MPYATPHLPARRTYGTFLATILIASSIFAKDATLPRDPPPSRQPGDSIVPFSQAQFAAALLAETNRVRRSYHLPVLEGLPELDAAADDQAWYIALRFHVQHSSDMRDQETPMDRVRRHGIQPQSGSENAASIPVQEGDKTLSGPEIASALVAAWLASPGHRANLLNPDVTHFGGAVRVVHTPLKVWYAYGIQVFVRIGPARFAPP